jgi:hypothetical protein
MFLIIFEDHHHHHHPSSWSSFSRANGDEPWFMQNDLSAYNPCENGETICILLSEISSTWHWKILSLLE